jgi:hypothetical protein
MSKELTLKVKGIGQFQKKMKDLPTHLQKQIAGEIEDSARKINGKQLRLVPVDEGGTKQATGFKKTKPLETELFSNKKYTPFMEFGTKSKAKIPAELQEYAKQFNEKGPKITFEDFLKIIAAWVRRKGIAGRFSVKTKRRLGSKTTQADEDTQAAYPIAVSILNKGVNPHPFFFQPFFDERKALVERVRKIVEGIDI